jgi:predicted O-methyltransferase YrrM
LSTLVDLVALYEGAGFTVQTGLAPAHFPGADPGVVPFSYLFGPDGQACKGGGIAPVEISFFEALCERQKPARVFIIGNAFGWSTLALALINRNARVVAIDYCPRPEEAQGIEVTNALARRAGLDAIAIKGKSPDDVAAICAREFDGTVDLAFIDGGHTNPQQTIDFAACRAVAAPDAVFVMHDVVNFGMTESFVGIAQRNPDLVSTLLFRTPSGMGMCYPALRSAELGPVAAAYTETETRMQALLDESRRRISEARNG